MESQNTFQSGDDYQDDDSWSEDGLDSLLFYTPKIVSAIDDSEILAKIREKYPNIDDSKCELKASKKAFCEFLDDEDFVKELMTYYRINMFSFTKIFQKHYAYLFSTSAFIKKVALLVKSHKYDKFKVEE